MVREFFGAGLFVFAIGSAAALLAPSLFATPHGRPMIVSGAEVPGLHEARFNAADCFPASLLEPALGSAEDGRSVLAVTFHRGPEGVLLRADDVSSNDQIPEQALIIVLDSSGRVLTAGPSRELTPTELGHGSSATCGIPLDSKPGLI
jgi:hypothetical protein